MDQIIYWLVGAFGVPLVNALKTTLALQGKAAMWLAAAVAAVLAADLEADPTMHVALVELVLEATRRPWLREEVARWNAAHLRLAELGLRAVGAPDPAGDARIVVATISGLLLGQLADPAPDFEERIFRPALERLFASLAEGSPLRAAS